MYCDMGFGLRGQPVDYIPIIDYTPFDTDRIKMFCEMNQGKKMVFISNGNVQSNQAENFNFTPIITALADYFKDVLFFITTPIPYKMDNVIDANLLTDAKGCNLPELSYLSTYCHLIVGRNSGPQVFTWTRQNCFDPGKVNMTFSKAVECGHFVYSSVIPMKRLWSNETNLQKVANIIGSLVDNIGKDVKYE
jgi:hypothetical protein